MPRRDKLLLSAGAWGWAAGMLELTPRQIAVLERFRNAGFALAAFPLYASYLGVKKGNCAVLLVPVNGAGMNTYGEACYLVGGNLGVRMTREGRDWFVWKKEQVEATPARLQELRRFMDEVNGILAASAAG
jgi:hypothetical protein